MNDTKGKCRSCGAPVLWLSNTNGNIMPIDPSPVENGNIVIRDDGRCQYVGTLSTLGMFGNVPRYVSHFVTCPDANKWRKKSDAVLE